MSSSAARRKRAAPKARPQIQPQPQPQPRAALSSVLTIAQAQDAAADRDAARPIDPPLTSVSPDEVVTAATTRMRAHLPQRLPDSDDASTTREAIPTAALAALVHDVAAAALDALTAGWTRVVAQERARRTAAAAHNEQQRDVGAQWNLRSRVVAVLGAPCMGCGRHVLPFLRRSVEGRAVHATSRELGGACRQSRWAREVLLHSVCGASWRCWVWGAAAECQCVPVVLLLFLC